ncbi:hypothetical protein D1872_136700 [compost metagenome]
MVRQLEVNLNKLYFDPENPRLPQNSLDSQNELEVIDYMVRYGNIVELMQSLGETGYSVAEPLLVVPKLDDAQAYIVVEGNRRLAALKLLSNPDLTPLRKQLIRDTIESAKHIPKDIPVIIYPNRAEVLDYLGYRHITGVKDWGALEKARYLDQLYRSHIAGVEEGKIYSILAKMIGSRTDYVAKLHTALKLYDLANNEAYYGSDIEEKNFNFSWLTTALSFKDTVSYIGLKSAGDSSLEGLNEEKYAQLFIWLFDPKERKVQDSREIADLNKILESKPAIEKLEKGSTISEAILFTSAPVNTFEDLIKKAKVNLQSSKNIIEQLSFYPEEAVVFLDDIEKLCKSIRGALLEVFPKKVNNINHLSDLSPDQIQRLLTLIEKQGE